MLTTSRTRPDCGTRITRGNGWIRAAVHLRPAARDRDAVRARLDGEREPPVPVGVDDGRPAGAAEPDGDAFQRHGRPRRRAANAHQHAVGADEPAVDGVDPPPHPDTRSATSTAAAGDQFMTIGP